MEPLEVLRSHPLLSLLPDAELLRLRRRSVTRRWKKDDVVFHRGDPCVGVHAVVSGSLVTMIEGESGRTLTLGTYGPGGYVGALAATDGGSYHVTAAAREASCTLLLTLRDFNAAVASLQDARERIIGLLCNEIRNNLQFLETILFHDVSTRLARIILHLQRRHAVAVEALPTIRFSQKEIAGLLGCSREWVGKELGKWREAGIIDIGRSQMVVRDRSALDQIAAARRQESQTKARNRSARTSAAVAARPGHWP